MEVEQGRAWPFEGLQLNAEVQLHLGFRVGVQAKTSRLDMAEQRPQHEPSSQQKRTNKQSFHPLELASSLEVGGFRVYFAAQGLWLRSSHLVPEDVAKVTRWAQDSR